MGRAQNRAAATHTSNFDAVLGATRGRATGTQPGLSERLASYRNADARQRAWEHNGFFVNFTETPRGILGKSPDHQNKILLLADDNTQHHLLVHSRADSDRIALAITQEQRVNGIALVMKPDAFQAAVADVINHNTQPALASDPGENVVAVNGVESSSVTMAGAPNDAVQLSFQRDEFSKQISFQLSQESLLALSAYVQQLPRA